MKVARLLIYEGELRELDAHLARASADGLRVWNEGAGKIQMRVITLPNSFVAMLDDMANGIKNSSNPPYQPSDLHDAKP